LATGNYRGGNHLATIWSLSEDNVVVRCRTFANRPVHLSEIPIWGFLEKSSHGAEKSCRPRRRKRGLRRGKRRSRERHSRRTVQPSAPNSKTPNARRVNHQGRKFLWAVRASEGLRRDCKKYAKFPVGPLPEAHPARIPRKRMKEHCAVKWSRLHAHAEACGIPPVAAFHSTFWKYLAVETSRGRADWEGLLAGLPGNPATDRSARGLFDRLEERAAAANKRRDGGRNRGAMNNPRGGRGTSRSKRYPRR